VDFWRRYYFGGSCGLLAVEDLNVCCFTNASVILSFSLTCLSGNLCSIGTCRKPGSGFGFLGFGFWVLGLGFWIWG
jgi:hypothetical protein